MQWSRLPAPSPSPRAGISDSAGRVYNFDEHGALPSARPLGPQPVQYAVGAYRQDALLLVSVALRAPDAHRPPRGRMLAREHQRAAVRIGGRRGRGWALGRGLRLAAARVRPGSPRQGAAVSSPRPRRVSLCQGHASTSAKPPRALAVVRPMRGSVRSHVCGPADSALSIGRV